MTFRGFACFARWVVFTLYLSAFFAVPLGLLWNLPGLGLGVLASLMFLTWVRFDGSARISRRLEAKPLTQAQSPKLFGIAREYCRRLGIPMPQLAVIDSPALNIAVYGFSRRSRHLALTQGLINSLSREQLAAIVGRQLSYLWYEDVTLDSWLSQFLAVIDQLAVTDPQGSHSKRTYSYKRIVRQICLYPLIYIPNLLLTTTKNARDLDLKSVKVTRKPIEFAAGLRLMEAFHERIPFYVPLDSRHLFLMPPQSQDPVGRVFLESVDLRERVLALSQLAKPVPLGAELTS